MLPIPAPDLITWFAYLDHHEGQNQDSITYTPFEQPLKEKGFVCLSQIISQHFELSHLQTILRIELGTAISILDYMAEDIITINARELVLPSDN